MDNIDISLKTPKGRFNYRVGAIIIDSDKILMAKNAEQSFYYTIGGRVNFGESAQEAVIREAFEETKIKFEIDRLAYIHENFFTWEIENEPFHEIALFFLLKQNDNVKNIKQKSFQEEYGEVALHWLPINELESFQLYPEFFKSELMNIKNEVKYFVTRNEVTLRK